MKEKSVQLELDSEQFLALVQSLCLARWVAAARRPEDAPSAMEKAIRELEELVLSRADELGLGDLVEFDHESGGYYPTRKYEDASQAREAIERYEDDFFWSELVRLLTKRDLDRGNPGEAEALSKMGPGVPRHPVEERYWEEFHRNGLGNLLLVRPHPSE